MALYTLTPEIWGRHPRHHVLKIRPEGWMPDLRGHLRSYNADEQAFAHDLRRFLGYTADQIAELLQPGALPRIHHNVELTDEDAGYLQWSVESSKRIYIQLRIQPLPQKHTDDLITVTLFSASGQKLSRALPLKSRALFTLLRITDSEELKQFVWQQSLKQREPFNVITVPHLWKHALSLLELDLNDWLTSSLPEEQPILVFADAIRSDLFGKELQDAYREWHTFTCPGCTVSYALVAQITDQNRFDGLPPADLQPFCFLRRTLQAEHPGHSAERLRSSGVSAWPAPVDAKPIHLVEVDTRLSGGEKLDAGLLP